MYLTLHLICKLLNVIGLSLLFVFLKGMQGTMNQMVPPMPQGHFMGMNPMHSGSLSTNAPQVGGFPNSLPNMQGPSNVTGNQMYPQGGPFNRPQAGQMQMMPGFNPYQVIEVLLCSCNITGSLV